MRLESKVKRSVTLVLLLAAFTACGGNGPAVEHDRLPELSKDELAAIRALNSDYTRAWLADDREGVMATFTEDAVLMPALGTPSVAGSEAIREFYWPPDSPAGKVLEFEMNPEEIAGQGDLATIRGTMSLVFSMEQPDGEEAYQTSGNYLMVMHRLDTGEWRIARYIWNHPPWEVVPSDRLEG